MDFGPHRLVVRGGKGGQDRTTLLPRHRRDAVPTDIEAVKALLHQDRLGHADVTTTEMYTQVMAPDIRP